MAGKEISLMVGQGSGGFTLSRVASLSLFCARASRYFVLYMSIVYARFASILSNGLARTLDFWTQRLFSLGTRGYFECWAQRVFQTCGFWAREYFDILKAWYEATQILVLQISSIPVLCAGSILNFPVHIYSGLGLDSGKNRGRAKRGLKILVHIYIYIYVNYAGILESFFACHLEYFLLL